MRIGVAWRTHVLNTSIVLVLITFLSSHSMKLSSLCTVLTILALGARADTEVTQFTACERDTAQPESNVGGGGLWGGGIRRVVYPPHRNSL